jgi:tetratricopeptide (TPR) repeat protein
MFKLRQMQAAQVSAAVMLSLALAFTVGCNRDPNVRKQKYLESGMRYEAAGKYKEAAVQFLNALKVDKNFSDAHYEMAKTYLKLNSPQPAYGELMKTVQLSPNNVQARIDLGNLLLDGRVTSRAEEQAKAVLAINPNNADAYALLAGVAQQEGDNASAIQNIQRAMQINPNRASYHTEAALLQTADPAKEAAVESELGKAASLDAADATPHLVLASLLEKKGDLQGAEQQFASAIAIAPQNVQARSALAGLEFREGRKDNAEQTLHQAVVDLPESEEAATLLKDYYGKTGQLERGESVFADLTAKYPKSFAIKITYAGILFDRRDYAKASSVAADLTKNNAGNPLLQILNALLLLNGGKTDDALAMLQKAVKDNPNNVQIQLMLAQVAASKGDMATAEASFQNAAKLNPGNLEAASGLAQIAILRNDAGLLTEVAEKTMQQHPDFVGSYLWRGTAEASRKEYDKAQADYQTVIKMSPDNSSVYLQMAELQLAQGHIPEGKVLLQKSLDKDPNSVRAAGMLAAYDLQANQPAKAVERLQAQIAKEPANAGFYSDLAAIQLQTKDYKGALASAQKAMQLNPTSIDAVNIYTRAEIGLNEVDSAIGTWQAWIGSHPSDSHAWQLMGSLQEAKGDPSKAMEEYQKALQIDPNNAVAANNLAYLMVENGQNLDVALTLAQTARHALPDSPHTADTLAWVYYYKANYYMARDLLEGALKTTQENPSMQLHLGLTYSKMNDKPDAILHLKKAAVLDPAGKTARDASEALLKLQ